MAVHGRAQCMQQASSSHQATEGHVIALQQDQRTSIEDCTIMQTIIVHPDGVTEACASVWMQDPPDSCL